MSIPNDQPVGPLVEHRIAGQPVEGIEGRYVNLERINEEHLNQLWDVIEGDDSLWTYMLSGPYKTKEEFVQNYSSTFISSEDPFMYAIIDKPSAKAIGCLALMRFDRPNRATEIGHVLFSKKLQRTRGATESFYLMMQIAFNDTLNTRRLEWKCNNLNQPSKNAAQRLGYTFEGIFRNHYIVKGRSRDTAWYSILDTEWPVIKRAFDAWLDSSNFDQNGQQKKGLVQIRQSLTGEKV